MINVCIVKCSTNEIISVGGEMRCCNMKYLCWEIKLDTFVPNKQKFAVWLVIFLAGEGVMTTPVSAPSLQGVAVWPIRPTWLCTCCPSLAT